MSQAISLELLNFLLHRLSYAALSIRLPLKDEAELPEDEKLKRIIFENPFTVEDNNINSLVDALAQIGGKLTEQLLEKVEDASLHRLLIMFNKKILRNSNADEPLFLSMTSVPELEEVVLEESAERYATGEYTFSLQKDYAGMGESPGPSMDAAYNILKKTRPRSMSIHEMYHILEARSAADSLHNQYNILDRLREEEQEK